MYRFPGEKGVFYEGKWYPHSDWTLHGHLDGFPAKGNILTKVNITYRFAVYLSISAYPCIYSKLSILLCSIYSTLLFSI